MPTPGFIGEDRIVLSDVIRRGLHRLHVKRSGDWPDETRWDADVPADAILHRTRHWWRVGNEYHLYITWPTPEPQAEYWDHP